MPIPDRPRAASCDPRYRFLRTDDGSWTLELSASGDTFHSGCGALTECQHVYLENSGIAELLRNGASASVLEVGFGTGMSMLITAAMAVYHNAPLRYRALENQLLPVDLFRELSVLNQSWGGNPYAPLCAALAMQWPERLKAGSRTAEGLTWELSPQVTLELHTEDAVRWAPDTRIGSLDAIYFDPFSPASNPQLWMGDCLHKMIAALRPGGKLVSYCVKSQVRSELRRLGMEVLKYPGPPGGKREVLVAIRHC